MSDDFDRFMDDYHAEPDAEFAKNLLARLDRLDEQAAQSAYQRLWSRFTDRAGNHQQESMPNQKGHPMKPRSSWKVRLVVAVMILGFLVAMPPFRALATDILQQLGVLKITNGPTYLEQELAHPDYSENQPETLMLDGIGPVPSAASVSAEVGFPVYVAQQLPAGVSVFDRGVGHDENNIPVVITQYLLNPEYDMFMLAQSTLVASEIPVGAVATQKVMVGANEGVWIEHIAMSKTGPDNQEPGYNNLLIWHADGYLFSLNGDTDDSLETMKSFAESLAPGQ